MAKTTSSFNSDHAIQQYSNGFLLESPFVPPSTDRWAVQAKIPKARPIVWWAKKQAKDQNKCDKLLLQVTKLFPSQYTV